MFTPWAISSGVLCSMRPMRPPPQALLTRMSRRPHWSTAACTMVSTSVLTEASV